MGRGGNMTGKNITGLKGLEGSRFKGIVRSSSPGTLGYWETTVEVSRDDVITIGTSDRWEANTQVQGTIERTKSTPISFLVSHDIQEVRR